MDVFLYITGFLVLFLGIALSIGLHEFGHYLPAKKFGVRVDKFMIGFGPKLFSKQKGETEFGFKLIPLGGYVNIIGMYPPADALKKKPKNKGIFSKIINEARDYSAQEIKDSDGDRVFYKLSATKKVIVMLGGPLVNLILGFLFYALLVCGIGLPQYSTTISEVQNCSSEAIAGSSDCANSYSPALETGLKEGDTITEIDGIKMNSMSDIISVVSDSSGEMLAISYERNGEEFSGNITPKEVTRIVENSSGVKESVSVGIIGITTSVVHDKQPVWEVPKYVYQNTVEVAKMFVDLPVKLWELSVAVFSEEKRPEDGLVSVVGVGAIAGQVTANEDIGLSQKIQIMLSLLASLNIALFVFNLAPLVPLDGGRIVPAIYEGVKRKGYKMLKKDDPGPVDVAKLTPLTIVVASLLILMSVFLIIVDLVEPLAIF